MASTYKQLKQILFGRPLASDRLEHERLSKKTGLAVLSSDNISSVAYATEQTLIVLAVLGTAAGGLPEVVQDGVTGVLVEPRDHKAMAREIGEEWKLFQCSPALARWLEQGAPSDDAEGG